MPKRQKGNGLNSQTKKLQSDFEMIVYPEKGKVSHFFSRLFRALFTSSTKYEVSKNNWKDDEGLIGSLAATAGHNMVLEKLDKMPIMPGSKRVPGKRKIDHLSVETIVLGGLKKKRQRNNEKFF